MVVCGVVVCGVVVFGVVGRREVGYGGVVVCSLIVIGPGWGRWVVLVRVGHGASLPPDRGVALASCLVVR